MAYRQAPPTEISRTTLGAVIATIGATFLLIASMSHSWWTGDVKSQMGEVEFGVGLAGLEQCTRLPADIFADKPSPKSTLCARLPFGSTHKKMKIPGAWAFFGRATYYLSMIAIGLIVLSLGVLIGGNQVFGRLTPARCAVVASGMALVSGMVFIILKPGLGAAFEIPNLSVSASFGMFMHIFGTIAAGAGAALIVIDAPQMQQPAITYPLATSAARPQPRSQQPRAASEPVVVADTLISPPPAEAVAQEPPADSAQPPATQPHEAAQPEPVAQPQPPLVDPQALVVQPEQPSPQAHPHGQPPVAFYKPEPPPTPACKQCSGPTRYIETFHRAFCPRCEVYTRMA